MGNQLDRVLGDGDYEVTAKFVIKKIRKDDPSATHDQEDHGEQAHVLHQRNLSQHLEEAEEQADEEEQRGEEEEEGEEQAEEDDPEDEEDHDFVDDDEDHQQDEEEEDEDDEDDEDDEEQVVFARNRRKRKKSSRAAGAVVAIANANGFGHTINNNDGGSSSSLSRKRGRPPKVRVIPPSFLEQQQENQNQNVGLPEENEWKSPLSSGSKVGHNQSPMTGDEDLPRKRSRAGKPSSVTVCSNTENPGIDIKILKSHIAPSFCLNLPPEFARVGMVVDVDYEVINGVSCRALSIHNAQNKRYAVRRAQWKAFVEEKDLKPGDLVHMEVVGGLKLQMDVLRANIVIYDEHRSTEQKLDFEEVPTAEIIQNVAQEEGIEEDRLAAGEHQVTQDLNMNLEQPFIDEPAQVIEKGDEARRVVQEQATS